MAQPPKLLHDEPHYCPQCGAIHTHDDAQQLDAAVKWIRVVTEELVIAGFPAGDRTMQLTNIRQLLKERKTLFSTLSKLVTAVDRTMLPAREVANEARDVLVTQYTPFKKLEL